MIIGNDKIKSQIEMVIGGAKATNTSMPHMLFRGHSGCGKTSMALFVALKADVALINVQPDNIKTLGDVTNILARTNDTGYNKRGDRIGNIKQNVIFIDEIHRISNGVQEILNIVMERFRLPSEIPGKSYWVPYFTLIGATTDDYSLTAPFKSRFSLIFTFNTYEYEDMVKIIKHHSLKNGYNITEEAIHEIAIRSNGVPRKAVGYLKLVYINAMALRGDKIIDDKITDITFNILDINEDGLGPAELNLLEILKNCGPMSLDQIAIALADSKKNVMENVEPSLIRMGLLKRTNKGRELTVSGIEYVNKKAMGRSLIEDSYERL